MFDTKIANVIAYGGTALVVGVLALSALPQPRPETRPAAAPIVSVPVASPEQEEFPIPEPVPEYSLQRGGRIPMTQEQITGWPGDELPTVVPANASSGKVAPIPLPLSMRPKPLVAATVWPEPERSAPVVLGKPPGVLGTIADTAPSLTRPNENTGAVVTGADLREWRNGSLDDFLQGRRKGDGRFVPPADVGY